MRRPVSPRVHGLLEYVIAPVWALSPLSLGLAGVPAGLALMLAAGIVVVATLTDYPLGLLRVIPLRVHAWIDRCVTPFVVVMPWLAGFADVHAARDLFVLVGGFGLVVTLLTDFDAVPVRSTVSMRTRRAHHG